MAWSAAMYSASTGESMPYDPGTAAVQDTYFAVVAFAAAHRATGDHPVADLDPVYLRPYGDNLAHKLMPGMMGSLTGRAPLNVLFLMAMSNHRLALP